MRIKAVGFQSDPGLRRGDRTPKIIYGMRGQRVLAKHWPIVVNVVYDYPRGPYTVYFGKEPEAKCDDCSLNMSCSKSGREVTSCLLDQTQHGHDEVVL
jgi:hypothetical protein